MQFEYTGEDIFSLNYDHYLLILEGTFDQNTGYAQFVSRHGIATRLHYTSADRFTSEMYIDRAIEAANAHGYMDFQIIGVNRVQLEDDDDY